MDQDRNWKDPAWHKEVARCWRNLAAEYRKSNNPINIDLAAQASADARWHDRYAEKLQRYQALAKEP